MRRAGETPRQRPRHASPAAPQPTHSCGTTRSRKAVSTRPACRAAPTVSGSAEGEDRGVGGSGDLRHPLLLVLVELEDLLAVAGAGQDVVVEAGERVQALVVRELDGRAVAHVDLLDELAGLALREHQQVAT